jgi:hypothetical protein
VSWVPAPTCARCEGENLRSVAFVGTQTQLGLPYTVLEVLMGRAPHVRFRLESRDVGAERAMDDRDVRAGGAPIRHAFER